tara:strand:- start:4775 stop:5074 length:300 start_codon:yes stop_codon:yes gene_type:complete
MKLRWRFTIGHEGSRRFHMSAFRDPIFLPLPSSCPTSGCKERTCHRFASLRQPKTVSVLGFKLCSALRIRDAMRKLEPGDPHVGECDVWLAAQRIPDGG